MWLECVLNLADCVLVNENLFFILKELLWSVFSRISFWKWTKLPFKHETSKPRCWRCWRCPGRFNGARWCDPLGVNTSMSLLPVSAPQTLQSSICSCLVSTLAGLHQPHQTVGYLQTSRLTIFIKFHVSIKSESQHWLGFIISFANK